MKKSKKIAGVMNQPVYHLHKEVKKMDYESEINELKKHVETLDNVLKEHYERSVRRKNAVNALKERLDELEKCCEEFRACKGKIGERIDKLEQKG
jgi:chromosome segregation ATPase